MPKRLHCARLAASPVAAAAMHVLLHAHYASPATTQGQAHGAGPGAIVHLPNTLIANVETPLPPPPPPRHPQALGVAPDMAEERRGPATLGLGGDDGGGGFVEEEVPEDDD